MTEGFCPLRLLLKVHGNLSLKIIGKSDLSIFYPYAFESLSEEQLNIGIFEASQMMYSVISIYLKKTIIQFLWNTLKF